MEADKKILLIMKDKPGVLNKISGLFEKRGINIENITAGKTLNNEVRMTLSGAGGWKENTLKQVITQARKLYDVVLIKELEEKSIAREFALIKLSTLNNKRQEIVQLTHLYKGSIADISKESIVVELVGNSDTIDGYLEIAEEFGILEIARTGIVGMNRGSKL